VGPSWPQIKGFGNYLAKSMPTTILLTNKTVTKDANRTRYMVMAVIQSNYIYIYIKKKKMFSTHRNYWIAYFFNLNVRNIFKPKP